MAKLTSEQRGALPSKSFAVPSERKYPVPDKSHARNALARVSQFGSPSEKAAVRAKVHSKYPGIGQMAEGGVVKMAEGGFGGPDGYFSGGQQGFGGGEQRGQQYGGRYQGFGGGQGWGQGGRQDLDGAQRGGWGGGHGGLGGQQTNPTPHPTSMFPPTNAPTSPGIVHAQSGGAMAEGGVIYPMAIGGVAAPTMPSFALPSAPPSKFPTLPTSAPLGGGPSIAPGSSGGAPPIQVPSGLPSSYPPPTPSAPLGGGPGPKMPPAGSPVGRPVGPALPSAPPTGIGPVGSPAPSAPPMQPPGSVQPRLPRPGLAMAEGGVVMSGDVAEGEKETVRGEKKKHNPFQFQRYR